MKDDQVIYGPYDTFKMPKRSETPAIKRVNMKKGDSWEYREIQILRYQVIMKVLIIKKMEQPMRIMTPVLVIVSPSFYLGFQMK
ncbi:hypothetical protein F6Y02_37800 (plasmid) [Bacillus megaterium]|nr:hypothetical protein [Priestia megaterium]